MSPRDLCSCISPGTPFHAVERNSKIWFRACRDFLSTAVRRVRVLSAVFYLQVFIFDSLPLRPTHFKVLYMLLIFGRSPFSCEAALLCIPIRESSDVAEPLLLKMNFFNWSRRRARMSPFLVVLPSVLSLFGRCFTRASDRPIRGVVLFPLAPVGCRA